MGRILDFRLDFRRQRGDEFVGSPFPKTIQREITAYCNQTPC
jgi:hypothetical protein